VLVGGRKIEDTQQFRTALEHEQIKIREVYDEKM